MDFIIKARTGTFVALAEAEAMSDLSDNRHVIVAENNLGR